MLLLAQDVALPASPATRSEALLPTSAVTTLAKSVSAPNQAKTWGFGAVTAKTISAERPAPATTSASATAGIVSNKATPPTKSAKSMPEPNPNCNGPIEFDVDSMIRSCGCAVENREELGVCTCTVHVDRKVFVDCFFDEKRFRTRFAQLRV